VAVANTRDTGLQAHGANVDLTMMNVTAEKIT